MTQRRTLETILDLYSALDRLKSNSLTEADRTLITVLMNGIANDKDVRDYFWETVDDRKQYDQLKFCAAVIAAIEDARGTRGDKREIAHRLTGLSVGQVDHAIRDYGDQARARVEIFSGALDQLQAWTDTKIAESHKVREK